jgi:hypothetical protein
MFGYDTCSIRVLYPVCRATIRWYTLSGIILIIASSGIQCSPSEMEAGAVRPGQFRFSLTRQV